jgi:hypothetical protein
MMGEKMPVEVKVPVKTEKKPEAHKSRISILDLLGFKFISEK